MDARMHMHEQHERCPQVWIVSVFNDVRNNLNLARAVWHLRGSHTRVTADDDGKMQFLTLSTRRVIWMQLIQLARMFVAVALLYGGDLHMRGQTQTLTDTRARARMGAQPQTHSDAHTLRYTQRHRGTQRH